MTVSAAFERLGRWMRRAATGAMLAFGAWALAGFPQARAELASLFDDSGKLLATGGVSQVEGAAGGGLASWAVISGYETRDGVGVTAHETFLPTGDFTLHAPGIAVGLFDRVELSYAADLFSLNNDNLAPGGLNRGYTLHQDVFGAKVRLAGDIVYDQDTLLPALSAGLQYKHSNNKAVLDQVGAKSSDGVDFYFAATKLFLAQSLLVDATVRLTKANQFGLLGFGGPLNDDYRPEFEGSVAYLFSKRFVAGAEYRTKPSNLAKFAGVLPIAPEENAWDVFIAYFLNKNASITAAYVNLGHIADVSLAPLGVPKTLEPRDQAGAYVSLQLAY
jgi:hypothetical protein